MGLERFLSEEIQEIFLEFIDVAGASVDLMGKDSVVKRITSLQGRRKLPVPLAQSQTVLLQTLETGASSDLCKSVPVKKSSSVLPE
jgi:hypothetical protein